MNECNSLEIFPWMKMFYKKDTGIIDIEITIIMFYLVGYSGIHLQTNYFGDRTSERYGFNTS